MPDVNFQSIQNRIFRGVYYVKRLQPGKLQARETIESYGRDVSAITHDCSTLGGNSGSAVLMLPNSPGESVEVVGLHFAGAYLHANYAVSAFDLAADRRVVEQGVEFAGPLPPSDARYQPLWASADPESPSHVVVPGPPNGQTSTWTIPLEISVTFGTPTLTSSSISSGVVPAAPKEGLFGDEEPALSFEAAMALFSVASLSEDAFDWETALSLAVASQLVYQNQPEVESRATDKWGMDSCEFIEVDNTQCFIAASDDVALISFRGTKELGDWLSNLNAVGTAKSYGSVHRGFFYAFDAVKTRLAQELNALSPNSVLLTGHSLGGAIATIAAAEWNGDYPISGVYTFGQPAVGRGRFPTFFSDNYKDKFFRFVNDDDIVTLVPPNFRHIGRLLHFNAQGSVKPQREGIADVTDGNEPRMLSEAEFNQLRIQLLTQKAQQDPGTSLESLPRPALEGFFPSFSDHAISEYIRKIRDRSNQS